MPASDGEVAAVDADTGKVAAAADTAVPDQPDQFRELGLVTRRLRSRLKTRSSAMLRRAPVSGRGRV